MSLITDYIKCGLLWTNRLQGNLQRLNIVTYDDKIRLRSPGYHRQILFGQAGHDCVRDLLSTDAPLMISRLGSVELSCLSWHIRKRRDTPRAYSNRVRTQMSNQAGFFPTDDASLDAFAKLYLDKIPLVDLMGVWFNSDEDMICNTFCPGADLVELSCLEPFRFTAPWSSLLAGKKVLVVHPFSESINSQYVKKRHCLFADPDVLPEFELKTLTAVQSIAGSPVPFASWFDAYRHMCSEIEKTDFDVCLIGAGAYGLPLAAFVKELGRQAIHLGGATQILFGIRGRRWEELYADTTAQLFNGHWVRPLAAETPSNKEQIEKGCYW